MTTAEKLYQLIQILPEEQGNAVLNFAEFLHWKHHSSPQTLPSGTLTGRRGIAKRPRVVPSDDELRADYTDHLTQKYEKLASKGSHRY